MYFKKINSTKKKGDNRKLSCILFVFFVIDLIKNKISINLYLFRFWLFDLINIKLLDIVFGVLCMVISKF